MGRGDIIDLDTMNAILAQNDTTSQQLASLTKQLGQVGATLALVCDSFGGNHVNWDCEASNSNE